MSHLLDTNSFIDHLRRGPASNVTTRLAAAPPASVYLCSVVLAELHYGAIHSGAAYQAANLALIAKLRQQFVSLPFDDRAAEVYGGNDARITAAVPAVGELMKKAGKTFEPVTYEGAGHGFLRLAEDPNPSAANKKARDEAWQRWKELLKKLA